MGQFTLVITKVINILQGILVLQGIYIPAMAH